MEINAQIIKKGNKNQFAVLPYSEFVKIKEMIIDYEDLLVLRNAKASDYNEPGKSPQTLLEEIEKGI